MKKLLLIALTGLLAVGSAAPALALGPLDHRGRTAPVQQIRLARHQCRG